MKKQFKTYLEARQYPQRVTKWYVDDSEMFYTQVKNGYYKNIPIMIQAIEKAGGTKTKVEHKYGWDNQPQVIVFTAPMSIIPNIEVEIAKALDIYPARRPKIEDYYSVWDLKVPEADR